MALFPIVKLDEKVQIGDKIRIEGLKSFVSKGSTAISTLTVIPENDISAIGVYDADSDNWYLDWIYNDFEIDIDATNNKLDFTEDGSTALVATLSSGVYTLASLASEIKTQLDSAGAATYTVSYDVDDKITIATTGSLELLKSTGANRNTSILPVIGFKPRPDKADHKAASSVIGKRTEYLTRKITLEAGDGAATDTVVAYVKVYSSGGDALFSNDSELISFEPDLIKWVPEGKSSFNFVHREAQDLIIAWLDEKGFVDIFGEKFDKSKFIDLEEFNMWSKFMTLRIIFEGLSNSVDDIFNDKKKKFEILEAQHRNRAVLRVDIDADGQVDTFEDMRVHSGTVRRR